jgi:hypothetical protein
VSDIFHEQQHKPLLSKNAAPHSGAAMWVGNLKDRVVGAFHPICPTGTHLFQLCAAIVNPSRTPLFMFNTGMSSTVMPVLYFLTFLEISYGNADDEDKD